VNVIDGETSVEAQRGSVFKHFFVHCNLVD